MSLFEKVGQSFPSLAASYSDGSFDDITEATFNLAALESELSTYVHDASAQDKAFDVDSVPKISREQAAAEIVRE